ncbi:MAG TPA: hypothetical protein VF316_24205 [Polyangiaceae bacterium]
MHDAQVVEAATPPVPCVPLTGSAEVFADNLRGGGITLDALHVYVGEGFVGVERLDAISKADGGISSLGWGGAEYGIRNDADFVYWVSYGSLPNSPPQLSGVVSRVAKADGATTILAQGTRAEHEDGRWTNAAIDDTSVYWLDTGTLLYNYVDGQVMKVAKSGGKPVVLAPSQDGLMDIGVDSQAVYWTARAGLMQTPNGGATSTMVAFGAPPTFVYGADLLALDDAYVYFTDGRLLERASIATATTEVLYSGGDVVALTIDAGCVYFATNTAIFQIAKTGGVPSHLADIGGKVWRLAADESGLYFVDYGKGQIGRIKR